MSKPVKSVKSGGCEAAVWMKEFEGKPSFSFSFQKSYKGKDGSWKNTTFFNKTDLMHIRSIIDAILINNINKSGTKGMGEKLQQEFQGQPASPEEHEEYKNTFSDEKIPF